LPDYQNHPKRFRREKLMCLAPGFTPDPAIELSS